MTSKDTGPREARQILVVDDDTNMLMALREVLRRAGYTVDAVDDPRQAITLLGRYRYGLLVTDLRMPEIDGFALFDHARRHSPETAVIFLTAHGGLPQAVMAIKSGAFDFISKTELRLEELEEKVGRALHGASGGAGTSSPPVQRGGAPQILYTSEAMSRVLGFARLAAQSSAAVLIQAETGTGKELLARFVHAQSNRHAGPFVAVNCAAIPETLIEAELLGYGPSSGIAGANPKGKPGSFELADSGTIFLDEVADLSLQAQAKILRVLEDRMVRRLGDTREVPVDFRVVSATNRRLADEVAARRFREDLYFRLNVVPLTLPPLRERREDIALLAMHLAAKHGRELGRADVRFADDAIAYLSSYGWPGNVRELESAVRRAVILTPGLEIDRAAMESLGDLLPASVQVSVGETVRDAEKRLILKTLQETGGNRTRAAEILSISVRTMRNKIREYREEGEDIPGE